VGLTVDGEKKSVVRAFYDYLAGPAAMKILQKYGFGTTTAGVTAEGR